MTKDIIIDDDCWKQLQNLRPSPKPRVKRVAVIEYFSYTLEEHKKRTTSGLKKAREKGVKLGRPPVVKKKIKHVKMLKDKGFNVRKIAEILGCGKSAIYNYLKKEDGT